MKYNSMYNGIDVIENMKYNIMYGYTYNGIDVIEGALDGVYIDIYKDVLPKEGNIIIKPYIDNNDELNKVINYLLDNGIKNEDINIFFFHKNIYQHDTYIDIPNPKMDIKVIKVDIPDWLYKVCQLYTHYPNHLSFLKNININNPYLYINKDYPYIYLYIEKMISTINPDLSIKEYEKIRKRFKLEDRVDIRDVLKEI